MSSKNIRRTNQYKKDKLKTNFSLPGMVKVDIQGIIDAGESIKYEKGNEDRLSKLQKAELAYRQSLEKLLLAQERIAFDENGILDQLLNNNFNADNNENIAKLLFNEDQYQDINLIIKEYIKNENNFYNLMVDSIDKLEEGNIAFKSNKLLYQIGIIDQGEYKEFLGDSSAMSQLQKDKNVYRLQVSQNDKGEFRYRISTRTDLTSDIFFNSLNNVVSQAGANNYKALLIKSNESLQEGWSSYYKAAENDTILGFKTEAGNMRIGRLNEMYMKGRLSGNPMQYLEDHKGQNFYLDNRSWLYSQDQNFIINGQRYGMSQKSIVFNNNGLIEGYGHSLASYQTIVKGIELWNSSISDIDTLQKNINELSEQSNNNFKDNNLFNKMGYNFEDYEVYQANQENQEFVDDLWSLMEEEAGAVL